MRAREQIFFGLSSEKKKKIQISLSPADSLKMSAPPPPCAERMESGYVTANDGVELAYSFWLPEGEKLGEVD